MNSSLRKKLNQGYWPLIVLVIVCFVSTAVLALTNEITRGPIREVAAATARQAKQEIYAEASEFQAGEVSAEDVAGGVTAWDLALGSAENGKASVLGMIVTAQAKGYGGQVPVYVAYDREGSIVGVQFPENSETPGLGQRVREPWFAAQFVGKTAQDQFAAASIDAVSGATRSSSAASNALNSAAAFFRKTIDTLPAEIAVKEVD